ncbi:MAG: pyruvate, phosphate dikinase, partial [bacterium]
MIVLFNEGKEEMVDRLGLKGASLSTMASLGLPVPPGFILPNDICIDYFRDKKLSQQVVDELKEKIRWLEGETGYGFGDAERPLLVSVRSGAPVPMPGMMDTILNLGLNTKTVAGLAERGGEWFAYDCFRRFIQNFGEIVFGVDRAYFERILDDMKNEVGADSVEKLDIKELKMVALFFRGAVKRWGAREMPDDVMEQLILAIEAVFRSWENTRAVEYRNLYRIPHDLGTSVTIETMVYGNLGNGSAVGLATTRDPTTGEKRLSGEYLMNAQGDDILSGARRPRYVRELKDEFPEIYPAFVDACDLLEKHYRDAQEIEFTVENRHLYLLQTRQASRTVSSAIKIAVDMVNEGLITREEAIQRIKPETLDQILHRYIDPKTQVRSIARGITASPGAASGRVVFDHAMAEQFQQSGEGAILVKVETTTEDVKGLAAVQGILTARGGKTSHAAVVARGMGKPCVTGCEAVTVEIDKKIMNIGDLAIREGDLITIDGSTGRVFLGIVPMRKGTISPEFRELLSWTDAVRSLKVRANVDTPGEAKLARDFGAEGIGLCRTEQMLMAPDRLPIVRAMIMAESEEERGEHLQKLSEIQKQDFIEILEAMKGFPVTFRLLDPPLHEFMPTLDSQLMELAVMRSQGIKGEEMENKEMLVRRIRSLREANPMMGLRGCRLGILFPDIIEMQVEAIMEASCALAGSGVEVFPEILIPFVGHVNEVCRVRATIDKTAMKVMEGRGIKVAYSVGALIEIPRAALTAGDIAREVDFFSFGTNDLTQTTFGFSRDDAESKFLYNYIDKKILTDDPFDTIDED